MLEQDGKLLIVYKEDIEKGTFSNWNSLTSVNSRAFYDAKDYIKYIEIPSTIKSIGKEVFRNCENLKKVIISDECTNIEAAAFKYCSSLSRIKLPENLKTISKNMFLECYSLKKIQLPKNLKIIENNAFLRCSLKKVVLPEGLIEIQDKAFSSNGYLKEIVLPDSLRYLKNSAFSHCDRLESVIIGKNLNIISGSCFYNCSSLRKIDIPENIKEIEKAAFFNCSGLEKISFHDKDVIINRHSFNGCVGLKKIFVGDELINLDEYKPYINMNNLEVNGLVKVALWIDKKDVQKTNILYPANFLDMLDKKQLKRLYSRDITKHFRNIYDEYHVRLVKYNDINVTSFYKFAYYLGCFSDETYFENGKEISIAQQANVFLKHILDKRILSIYEFGELFQDLKLIEPNPETLKFFSHKNKENAQHVYDNLMYLIGKKQTLCDILNKFGEIKRFKITDSKGRVIQNASLRKKIECYLSHERFVNVKDEDIELANELAKFPTIAQEHYDEAVELKNKGKDMPSHILLKGLKEEIIKERIEKIKKDTNLKLCESKKLIEELYEKEFTYEWLDKHDPTNFTLGLYCDCCASIVSMLYGKDIMIDSVVRDDVQNLEIKDINGEIMAKATAYVNRESGYMVFNTVQVAKEYKTEENDIKNKIYLTIKRAVDDFVDDYSKLYPANPIKQVNVGLGTNDIYDILKLNCEYTEDILEVPGTFMDATLEQGIMYKSR